MKRVVLSVDLGGTNLRVAAVDETGEILFRTRRETPRAAREASQIAAAIADGAKECLENLESEVSAIAAAIPAIVDFENGIVLKSPNLPALNGFRLQSELGAELDLPCYLENDANAAAIGENWLGASKNCRNSILITLGTGVGGGIIIDDRILRGVDGTAGEIGHICVEPHDVAVRCGCGSHGCLEQYASATAVVRQAREISAQFPESEIAGQTNVTALEIFEAGKRGDRLALEIFRRQGFYLGIALGGLINLLNPEKIVIGGGAAAGWDLFAPEMIKQVESHAYREPAATAKIVRAKLGDDAGLLGAAKLCF